MEKIKWSEKVTNEVLESIGEKKALLSNILCRKANKKKSPSPWCHWRTDDRSERSRKKNTAHWWFQKQKKILVGIGGSWKSKKMETTVYESNISIFRKSMDLLISSIHSNNNIGIAVHWTSWIIRVT